MKECFHQECDLPVSLPDLESSWKFLSKVTQAIVLSVFELTMPPSDDSDIFECSNVDRTSITSPTDKYETSQHNFNETSEKPKRFPFLKPSNSAPI